MNAYTLLYSLLRHLLPLLRKLRFSLNAVLCIGTGVISALPLSAHGAPVEWTETAPGLFFGRYLLAAESPILRAEVLLIRVRPSQFNFRLVQALEVKQAQTSIDTLAQAVGGLLALNTHYFDTKGKALGLLVDQGKKERRLHRGGGVLTGVFYLKNQRPAIIHRDHSDKIAPDLALQAGPRIVVNGLATQLKPNSKANRRSGIAVTRSGEVLLYVTPNRFPGARMEQIQQMLLDPRLDIVDALNLDGGSSSQIFVAKDVSPSAEQLLYSGGDSIPVGLVVTRKVTVHGD